MITFKHEPKKLSIFHDKKLYAILEDAEEELLDAVHDLIIDIYCIGLRDRTVLYSDIGKVQSMSEKRY